jgi:hypothetical protein
MRTLLKNKIEFDSADWEQIEELCIIQCTGEEIARVMKIDYDTLQRRIKETYGVSAAEYIKTLASQGHSSLRRSQWKSATENENVTMQIWLGKQYLGQKDKEEVDNNTTVRIIDQTSDIHEEDDPAVEIDG